ncbi:sulfatase [Pedobacter gandavensis]|uniref:sulfatase n=1 Tax=Pedobacter gandavensis TaxID=2679963 RepID=UPI00292CAF6E|nr:sulfatase [Pedobacter gandavensis]
MKVSPSKLYHFLLNFSLILIGTTSSIYAQKKPNIIVFLVDDMGWQDTSLPFWTEKTPLNARYHTPNMERLAKDGVKFTNAYATPVCTPTRVSMMTGMNAAHHKVTNWTSPQYQVSSDNADEQFAPASWNYAGLSPKAGIPNTIHATPYPQLLKDAGYFTIHVGKAHWASVGTPGVSPYNLGFIGNIAGHAAGHPQSYFAQDYYGNKPGKNTMQSVPDLEEYYESDTFLTEALTLEALKTLEAPIKNKQPFYLNLAHYAVHVPLQADSRFYQKYLDQGLDPQEAKYASLLEGMDKSLGDVMDYLKAKKVDQNTIIIFMSDNGGLSLTPPRGGIAHTQNLPLKAGKGSVHEGGIREPMIVKWPGVVKPGSTANQYVIIEDFFPTILEMAGIRNYKTIQELDGQSMLPVLKQPNYVNNDRSLIWHTPNKWIPNDGPGINYKSAIRKGNWKLIYNMRDGTKELYDLKADIGELENKAAENPEKLKELSGLLAAQLKKWNSPMPIVKSTGKPVAMPDQTTSMQ